MSSRYFYSSEVQDTPYGLLVFFFFFFFLHWLFRNYNIPLDRAEMILILRFLQLIIPNSVIHNMRALFFLPLVLSFIPLETEAVHMNLTSFYMSGHIPETREENPFNIQGKIQRGRRRRKL